jgi:hypothetical protein
MHIKQKGMSNISRYFCATQGFAFVDLQMKLVVLIKLVCEHVLCPRKKC